MAQWIDLLTYLERRVSRDPNWHCEAVDRATPTPMWLADPWHNTALNAGAAAPALVVNIKSNPPANCLAIVRLGDLERLIASARALEQLVGPTVAELVADPETRAAAIADYQAQTKTQVIP